MIQSSLHASSPSDKIDLPELASSFLEENPKKKRIGLIFQEAHFDPTIIGESNNNSEEKEYEATSPKTSAKTFLRNLDPPNLFSDLCIATTGSDARDENLKRGSGHCSPLELIIIHRPSARISEPINKLKELAREEPTFWDPKFEIQDLARQRPLTYTSEEGKSTFFPSRSIDAVYLYGDKSIMEQYKQTVFESVRNIKKKDFNHWKKSFFEKEKNNLTNCLALTDTQSVNIETGTLSYDNVHLKSTKHCLLRVVQYWICLYIIEAVQNGLVTKDDFDQLPHTIEGRLIWLSESRFWDISPSDISRLVEAYKQALSWYGSSQNAFEEGQTMINVDPNRLQEVASIIDEFISRPIESLFPSIKS